MYLNFWREASGRRALFFENPATINDEDEGRQQPHDNERNRRRSKTMPPVAIALFHLMLQYCTIPLLAS